MPRVFVVTTAVFAANSVLADDYDKCVSTKLLEGMGGIAAEYACLDTPAFSGGSINFAESTAKTEKKPEEKPPNKGPITPCGPMHMCPPSVGYSYPGIDGQQYEYYGGETSMFPYYQKPPQPVQPWIYSPPPSYEGGFQGYGTDSPMFRGGSQGYGVGAPHYGGGIPYGGAAPSFGGGAMAPSGVRGF